MNLFICTYYEHTLEKGVWRVSLRYPNKVVMIFNGKCVHCFQNNNSITKQSEARFRLSLKEKMCFLRVIDKDWGHDIDIAVFFFSFLQPIQ